MDITTVLAVICSAGVFLAWFVLPHSKPERPSVIADVPVELPAMDIPAGVEPVSVTA